MGAGTTEFVGGKYKEGKPWKLHGAWGAVSSGAIWEITLERIGQNLREGTSKRGKVHGPQKSHGAGGETKKTSDSIKPHVGEDCRQKLAPASGTGKELEAAGRHGVRKKIKTTWGSKKTLRQC